MATVSQNKCVCHFNQNRTSHPQRLKQLVLVTINIAHTQIVSCIRRHCHFVTTPNLYTTAIHSDNQLIEMGWCGKWNIENMMFMLCRNETLREILFCFDFSFDILHCRPYGQLSHTNIRQQATSCISNRMKWLLWHCLAVNIWSSKYARQPSNENTDEI